MSDAHRAANFFHISLIDVFPCREVFVCSLPDFSFQFPYIAMIMGVDHGGDRGDKSPRIWSGGNANANCPPPDFVIYVQKWAFCGLQNTPKSVFGRGSAPDPAGGAHDASPDPLVGWRGDTPPHTPPHSVRTHLRRSPCVPPEVQPDLRLWPWLPVALLQSIPCVAHVLDVSYPYLFVTMTFRTWRLFLKSVSVSLMLVMRVRVTGWS